MLRTCRERLTLVLLGLLPFHAFLVTVLTKMIAGPGRAPLPWLAVWKELLLMAIVGCGVGEILTYHAGLRPRRDYESRLREIFRMDALDGIILGLIAIAIVLFAFGYPASTGRFAYGFKYDFVPLVAFLILRRVEWSDGFRATVLRVLLIVGAIVAAYGILTLFLPLGFFTTLGYSGAHSLYEAGKPLAAYHQIGESVIRRIQSTMSGPNQLGLWLLVPLAVALASLRRFANCDLRLAIQIAIRKSPIAILLMVALLLSFSRSAWIGAFFMVLVALAWAFDRKTYVRIIASLVALGVVGGIVASLALPQVFFRLSSSRGHLVRPIEGFMTMLAHPLGLGLGSAGPATNRDSETCVFLRSQDDPSWAKSTPSLCVFLGDTQVQPADHACNCPFLPENWYVQIGVELGILGFALYLSLVLVLVKRLAFSDKRLEEEKKLVARSAKGFEAAIFLAFIGVSTGAMFLHAWEDAAVAYTLWVLVATILPVLKGAAAASPSSRSQ
ncbi:MAG: hypothetical protein Greene041619_743 [Candidatus Peregrinibacteria bacterium Greene0416_19]|nr:MAG: hypothetical protein Greene041619_743 [Candidatus Peregrinibacteria bacterium Greene0416_19]